MGSVDAGQLNMQVGRESALKTIDHQQVITNVSFQLGLEFELST